MKKVIKEAYQKFLEIPYGYRGRLVKFAIDAGYDFDHDDLLDLYVLCTEGEEAGGYVMDYLKYTDMVVGLPYNLVMTKRKRRVTGNDMYQRARITYSGVLSMYPPEIDILLDMNIGAAWVNIYRNGEDFRDEILLEENTLDKLSKLMKTDVYEAYDKDNLGHKEDFSFPDRYCWKIELEKQNQISAEFGGNVYAFEYMQIDEVREIIETVVGCIAD